MHPPVITCPPVVTRIMSIGQAPGPHEAKAGQPFGWTAGKTLFQWFASIGVQEKAYRAQVYMAAVCRCFPGKQIQLKGKTGDRVPSPEEIAACRPWLERELALLQPELLILIGKLAINQFLAVDKLTDVIGNIYQIEIQGRNVDLLPLPHPSGLSTWFRTEPGKPLLRQALSKLAAHPTWQHAFKHE